MCINRQVIQSRLAGACLATLSFPCLAQTEYLGFAHNTTTSATSRGALGGAAGEVMTRLDGSEHTGWGRIHWPAPERRIEIIDCIVQDQDAASAETFDIILYPEDAGNPGYPLLTSPIPFASGVAGPAGTGAQAVVRSISVPGGVGVPIANEWSDIFVSFSLPANAAWPVDGLSIHVALGYAAGVNLPTFDVPGPAQGGSPPPTPALSNPSNSHGLYRIGTGPAAYSQRRMHVLDIGHAGAGGVGLAVTNQTSWPQSNFPGTRACPGTADFLSGSNPDVVGYNAGRSDDIAMRYRKTGLGNGLVFFLMEFDDTCVPEIAVSLLLPGSTGVVCMRNPTVTCVTTAVADEACCFTAIPPAIRASLGGLGVRQQAAAFNNTGGVDLGPCDLSVISSAPVVTGVTPLSGSEGTIVTISGRLFDSNPVNSSVSFAGGGARGKVISASPTQLQVQIGTVAALQSGDVTVVGGQGVALAPFQFVEGGTAYFVSHASRFMGAGPTAAAGVAFSLTAPSPDALAGTFTGTGVSYALPGGPPPQSYVRASNTFYTTGGPFYGPVLHEVEYVVCAPSLAYPPARVAATAFNLVSTLGLATASGTLLNVTVPGIVDGRGAIRFVAQP